MNIVAAQTESTRSHFLEQKSSGVSFEGAGITYGSQRQSTEQDMQGTGSVASTVGAISGDVNITAGKTYTQKGSDVMAPGGDISIAAQDVQITEARETSRTEIEQQFEKSGITLALNAPGITAMQTASSQLEAAEDTKDGRMKGLAVANTVDANNRQLHPTEAKLIKENASRFAQKLYGTDQPSSEQVEAAQAMLTASGKDKDSGILIRGSDISAGTNACLSAEGDVNLLAAENTASLSGSNKSDSGSLGISLISTRQRPHLRNEIRLALEANPRQRGQAHITLLHLHPIGEPAIGLKQVRVTFVAAQAQAGRDGERHLVAAVRDAAAG